MARLHDTSPTAIRSARGPMTQAEAGTVVGVTPRAWAFYEAGSRKISAAAWELFLLKTHQHPELRLTRRR